MTLNAALDYAGRGWPVFPCHPKTKRPLVKSDVDGEGGLKLATIDAEQIRAWWAQYPKAMVGVPTGTPIGAFVVDLDAGEDSKTGEIFDAKGLLAALVTELGVKLPPTWAAETPRTGRHLFLAVPPGEPMPGNRTNLIRRVDIRGDGGYVIAAPSQRDDGKSYMWLTSPDTRPLALAPGALLDCVLRRGRWADTPSPAARPAAGSAPSAGIADIDDEVRKYGLMALDRETRLVAQANEGGRNAALNIAALRMGELVAAGALTEAVARAGLEDAAAQCGLVKDDGLRACRATINSGFRDGLKQPRDLSSLRENAARRKARSARLFSASIADPRPEPPPAELAAAAPAAAAASAEKLPSQMGGSAKPNDGRKGAGRRASERRGGVGGGQTPAEKKKLDRRLAYFPLTDLGNAERFRERMRGRLLWCPAIGWLYWSGKRWARDGADEKVKIAEHEVVRSIQDEANAIADTDDDKLVKVIRHKDGDEEVYLSDMLRAWGRQSESNSKLVPISKHAAAYLYIDPVDLDADPFAINVENGTLVIRKIAGADYITFKPHDPDDLITKMAAVSYDPKAACPLYDRFMGEVQAKPENRRFLHQWKGLSLTGDVTEQRLCVFWGKGKNGKSVFEDATAYISGDYSETVPIETFLSEGKGRNAGQATPDLAILPGVRMLRTSEPKRNAALDEGLIKLATGGEPIQARHLNRDYFKFYPQFKLTISGNYRPKIEGADEGIWRRVILVPWLYTVPKEKQDKKLSDKLRLEASGILNRLLDGLRDWLDNGLMLPDDVDQATKEYRSDSDPLGRFLTACVEHVPGERVQSSVLHAVFCAWADSNGASKWTPTGFGRAMNERGFHKKQSDVIWWLDIRLTKTVADFSDHTGKPISQEQEHHELAGGDAVEF